jgi:hypothetical protein
MTGVVRHCENLREDQVKQQLCDMAYEKADRPSEDPVHEEDNRLAGYEPPGAILRAGESATGLERRAYAGAS